MDKIQETKGLLVRGMMMMAGTKEVWIAKRGIGLGFIDDLTGNWDGLAPEVHQWWAKVADWIARTVSTDAWKATLDKQPSLQKLADADQANFENELQRGERYRTAVGTDIDIGGMSVHLSPGDMIQVERVVKILHPATRNYEKILSGNLHLHDVVEHRRTEHIGRVTGFAHNGTTDVLVDDTGPYPQADFIKLSPYHEVAEPKTINEQIPASCDTCHQLINGVQTTLDTSYDDFRIIHNHCIPQNNCLCTIQEDERYVHPQCLTLHTIRAIGIVHPDGTLVKGTFYGPVEEEHNEDPIENGAQELWSLPTQQLPVCNSEFDNCLVRRIHESQSAPLCRLCQQTWEYLTSKKNRQLP